ncbi:MAG: SAM-dependent methyltransferase [Hyphomicrobiaceae bacterium]
MNLLECQKSAVADYYNDPVIAAFYQKLWGGSDIHIGLFVTGDETVAEASRAMTLHLLELAGVTAGQKVLDIACGYGGTLRLLADMGCEAAGIDISETCISYARTANAAAGFDDIAVSLGDFHAIDSEPAAWDAVICQEAIIHATDRPKVFAEAYRVLRAGGVFAFSDILTAPGADLARVGAAYARLRAESGATVRDYEDMARSAGFKVEYVEQRPNDIATHYDKLADALASNKRSDAPLVASIKSSVILWQEALANGDIAWACFVARKPE